MPVLIERYIKKVATALKGLKLPGKRKPEADKLSADNNQSNN